jgi:hypothetical protein
MIAYAPDAEALDAAVPVADPLPPQIILPVANTVPAIVLSPLLLGLMSRLEEVAGNQTRGRDLWRRVVGRWAECPWSTMERRLGPRLRDGGFPPASRGQGVLESVLRSYGWWPPSAEDRREALASRPDRTTVDLVEGFLAWSHPFRWAGGWDWLVAGLDADRVLRGMGPLTRTEIEFHFEDRPPTAPRPPLVLPAGLRAVVGGERVREAEERWRELLSDPVPGAPGVTDAMA